MDVVASFNQVNEMAFSSSSPSTNISVRGLTLKEVVAYAHSANLTLELESFRAYRMTTDAFGTSKSSMDLVAISRLKTPVAKL